MRKIHPLYHQVGSTTDFGEKSANLRKSPGYGASFLNTSKTLPVQRQKAIAAGRPAIQMDKVPGENIEEHIHTNPHREINLSFFEDNYSEHGKILIEKFKSSKQGASTATGGDTTAVDAFSYAPWFSQLQKLLIERTTWGKDEEEAQNLLRDYVKMRIKYSPHGKLHPSLEYILDYIGRSEANDAANASYKTNLPHAAELGGANGAKSWCAQAASTTISKAFAKYGLKFKKGYTDWLNKGKGKSKLIGGKTAHTAKLFPGDIISLIGAGTPVSGHVATVIEMQGDKILMVSGNAGGGGGSVRVEEVTRAQPPAGYDWYKAAVTEQQAANPGVNKPVKAGEIWVVTISRLSDLDPSQIDPNDKAYLDKNGLERIPVTK